LLRREDTWRALRIRVRKGRITVKNWIFRSALAASFSLVSLGTGHAQDAQDPSAFRSLKQIEGRVRLVRNSGGQVTHIQIVPTSGEPLLVNNATLPENWGWLDGKHVVAFAFPGSDSRIDVSTVIPDDADRTFWGRVRLVRYAGEVTQIYIDSPSPGTTYLVGNPEPPEIRDYLMSHDGQYVYGLSRRGLGPIVPNGHNENGVWIDAIAEAPGPMTPGGSPTWRVGDDTMDLGPLKPPPVGKDVSLRGRVHLARNAAGDVMQFEIVPEWGAPWEVNAATTDGILGHLKRLDGEWVDVLARRAYDDLLKIDAVQWIPGPLLPFATRDDATWADERAETRDLDGITTLMERADAEGRAPVDGGISEGRE
jgi:hypothetical protein